MYIVRDYTIYMYMQHLDIFCGGIKGGADHIKGWYNIPKIQISKTLTKTTFHSN